MSDPILQALRESADLALKSPSIEEGMGHLSRAFSLFSNAYDTVQKRLDSVNRELKRHLFDLNRLTLFLNNVLRSTAEGILFLDLEGKIVLLNDAAERLLHLDRDKALLQPLWDLLPDDVFGFSMKETLRFGMSHKLIYKSLPPFELEISTSFLYEGPRPYHGLIVVLRDVSEKQKLVEETHRSERFREMGEMAALLAHEIRNPLGAIRGYASLLHRDLVQFPPLQEMASHILQGTKNLESLVSSVLEYARPIELRQVSTEIAPFLRNIVSEIRVDPRVSPTIRFEVHCPDDPIIAPIDPQAMQRALLNLIFNGIQAMASGGLLTISLLKQEKTYQIGICDTGKGIEEALLEKLFSRFFTTKEKGSGLGLVETQKIVQAHSGSIDVRSVLGKGSTFTLTLPLRRSS